MSIKAEGRKLEKSGACPNAVVKGPGFCYNVSVFRKKSFRKGQVQNMQKYICDVCGYIYDPAVGDPDNGIAAGTAFEDIPEGWLCPLCGVGKDQFSVTE